MDDKSLEYEKIANQFRDRIRSEFSEKNNDENINLDTKAYLDFKKQYMPKHLNIYEKVCRFAEKNFNFKPDAKKIPQLQEAINVCHLNTTPTGVNSAAMMIPIFLVLTSMILFYVFPLLIGKPGNLFMVIFGLLAGFAIMIPLQNLPMTFANNWRMKASNQMVLSIFYIVTYMRHTSNLERAINFAAEYLPPPLSLDFRKVVWDVETQRYDSIKESLDNYLDNWRVHNIEFVESINLIESSLMETSEDRRLTALDKSLEVILNETYEKMLHYAHNLKGPLTTLNMLGVVLPILTLVILPLVVSLMEGFKWYHLFIAYNVVLPVMVLYLGKTILSTRPGGSGNTDITELNPELKKFKKIAIKLDSKHSLYLDPLYFCLAITGIMIFIGLFPVIWHTVGLPDYALINDDGYKFVVVDPFLDDNMVTQYFLEYRKEVKKGEVNPDVLVGPFSLIAVLLSLCLPLGIALGVGYYNRLRTKNVIQIREQAKKLELEFSSALFQLGNRIGDGIPAEIAFGKVGSQMKDTVSGKFFMDVSTNITNFGMSVNDAIFNKKNGVIKDYPSEIISSSMKVLVESSKKGPLIASQALINVAEYIKQMHRIDERLNDLMGDTVSGMRSQIAFLTPVISSIVVAITALITKIMGKLSMVLTSFTTGVGGGGDMPINTSLLSMFGTGIPTYHFVIVVGLYVVEIAYILTVISHGIENGVDNIGEQASLGNFMIKSGVLYTTLAFILIIVFNLVSGSILSSLTNIS